MTRLRRHHLRAVTGAVSCAIGLTVALVAGPAAAAAPTVPPSGTTPTPGTYLKVGSQVLAACGPAWCGRLTVPLDPEAAGPGQPTISIAYRWYSATDTTHPTVGTLVPVEGGPGYPSAGSVEPDSFGGYASMYGPLREHRNILAVDLRGTAGSALIDCPALQGWSGPTGTTAFERTAAACATSVDHRYTGPGGVAVQASDLFTSAPAAADVAAVITALRTGPVDLYGDSYGSFFAQVFASRYPRLIRSVILDSTYETRGLDPWYRSSIESLRTNFDTVCQRSVACTAAGDGGWTDIEALAARLRAAPVTGTVPGPDGRPVTGTLGVVGLVDLVNDAAEDLTMYRELDGAARSLLADGDPDALLRLYAQRFVYDENYFDTPARFYSGGLYLATSCLDYPQLFSMDSPPAQRRVQLAAAEAALPADTFAPFSTTEWLDMDQNTEAYTACLDWPSPNAEAEPPVTKPAPLLPASMPVLILGGELDAWTPPVDLPMVEALIGGHSRAVIMANSIHVEGEDDGVGCASSVIQSFVANPAGLDTLDASCAARVPTVHTVGNYPDRLDQEPPMVATAGAPTVSATVRELAAAAVDTAGDAWSREAAIGVARDTGLHGGTASVGGNGSELRLKADALVPGVAVSGTVRVAGTTVTAALAAVGPRRVTVHVTATWSTTGAGTQALARVTARSAGTTVRGTVPAP